MKPLCPRHKRLKREGRLQAAKHWLPEYDGKNIVKGYSKHFGVNKLCAALELQMLGYKISPDYLEQFKVEFTSLSEYKNWNFCSIKIAENKLRLFRKNITVIVVFSFLLDIINTKRCF